MRGFYSDTMNLITVTVTITHTCALQKQPPRTGQDYRHLHRRQALPFNSYHPHCRTQVSTTRGYLAGLMNFSPTAVRFRSATRPLSSTLHFTIMGGIRSALSHALRESNSDTTGRSGSQVRFETLKLANRRMNTKYIPHPSLWKYFNCHLCQSKSYAVASFFFLPVFCFFNVWTHRVCDAEMGL